jgi:prenyltransferase beta subunit
MLAATSAAPKLLRDAGGRVVEFIKGQAAADGGFRGRGAASDLYYTVFAVECLRALDAPLDEAALITYAHSFVDGAGLDLVHLSCLARLWARLDVAPPQEVRRGIARRLGELRSGDGGFGERQGSTQGSAYAAFLAVGAGQDLGQSIVDAQRLVAAIERLRAEDGSYGNAPGTRSGSTPSTAAAIVTLRHLGAAVDPLVGAWLLARSQPAGGFLAVAGAPVPDLLATATALHALRGLGISLATIRTPCLEYLDSLWSPRGAFRGTWADNALDCEYTYYGLLALGNLA